MNNASAPLANIPSGYMVTGSQYQTPEEAKANYPGYIEYWFGKKTEDAIKREINETIWKVAKIGAISLVAGGTLFLVGRIAFSYASAYVKAKGAQHAGGDGTTSKIAAFDED